MNESMNALLSIESEWVLRRCSMVLAVDEEGVNVNEMNQAEVEAYIGRRYIGLNQIEMLQSFATAPSFVPVARSYFKDSYGLDTSNVSDAQIGYLALRAMERSALNYAETRFYELRRHARMLRCEGGIH